MPTPEPTVDRMLEIRDLQLRVRLRRGDAAPPLLLVAGLGGSCESWAPLLRELPGRDVIMIDLPGSGKSQCPPLPLRLGTVADMIVTALDQLGITSVDVLGFSLGGLVAQEIVRRHRARVRRLVLASTTFGIGGIPPMPAIQRALWSSRRFRSADVAVETMRTLAGGRTAADPEALAAVLEDRAGNAPTARGYYYQFLSTLWWSSMWWLHTLDVPALVLHGAADPVVSVQNARIVSWLLPDAQLQIVPGAGHLALFDQASDVAGPIERFLDS